MSHEKRYGLSCYAEIHIQTIPLENAIMGLDPQFGENRLIETKVIISYVGIARDFIDLDRLSVSCRVAHHNGNIDPAAVIAIYEIFMPEAMAYHLEKIAILEGIERSEIVHFLQAKNISPCFGNSERRHLAHIVCVRHSACLLEKAILRLIVDFEQLQGAILMQFIAKAGKIEPAHQIFDIESGYGKHVFAISLLAMRLARG
jgi:hypothetical protein